MDQYCTQASSKNILSSSTGPIYSASCSSRTAVTSQRKFFTASAPPASLTHVDSSGKASMVDVGQKARTSRVAVASGTSIARFQSFHLVKANQLRKGDVMTVAQLAGIMGAKHTSLLIPLCHNIPLNRVAVKLTLDSDSNAISIQGTASTTGPTGVEMEALTAVSTAALTVYDMCKAVSKDICITDIRLEAKMGGRSGMYERR